MAEELKQVFVVGTGRSGTTIAGRSLQLHSELTGVSFEPQIFAQSESKTGLYILMGDFPTHDMNRISSLKKYLLGRFTTEQKKEFFLERPSEYERLVLELFEKIELQHPIASDVQEAISSFVRKLYGPIMARDGAARFVDDSPVNGLFMPEILRAYPSAKFIHMYRDGISVADSFVEKNWNNNFVHALHRWHSQFSLIRKIGHGLRADQYIEVELSELSSDPNKTLGRVQAFLELSRMEDIGSLISPERSTRKITDRDSHDRKMSYFHKYFPELFGEFYQ